MSDDKSNCILCNGKINYFSTIINSYYNLFECVNCGSYIITSDQKDINKDIYAHYLFHNNRKSLIYGYKNYLIFIGRPDAYDVIFEQYPYSRLLKVETLESWYPKSFSERIDYILISLANIFEYPGQVIELSYDNLKSLFFINRFLNGNLLSFDEMKSQTEFIRDYMFSQNLLEINRDLVRILPEGWHRIDTLQKNNSHSKQVFIAMSFSEEAKPVREKIKEGIINAGYFPFVMDEYEHNKQIVPEILYQIKQSKFVVAEFTINNNGAYYEAGFAAGLGKEVIHVCNEKAFKEQGHFDIKQKYAVFWENEDKIPDALQKRIEATIGKG